MKIIKVALDVPLATLFDYRHDAATELDVGCRVVVPFGKKRLVGVIMETADSSSVTSGRLKTAFDVLRDSPRLEESDLELLRFASHYYHYPLGAAVMGSLPPQLRRPRPPPSSRKNARGAAPAAELPTASSAPTLTPEQERALSTVLADPNRFQSHLVLGVTGSGKTEIYLQAIAAVLAAGRQALLLVPEISLTPQLETLVRARFPGMRVVALHSALSEHERTVNWLAAQSGHARVVLGTRLAVFAPMPRLGIIIIDEEHDASFKQTDRFRYSARDIAVVRASRVGVPVVLGSATPSLESYFNAVNGRYRLSTLTQRIGAPLPSIECVDTRGERLEDGLSARLRQALDEYVARGEQSLVFINRRGYAPVLMCHSCGWISGCHRCSAKLVLHLGERRLRCHHCGHAAAIPQACADCGNPQLAPMGQGTQRVEGALSQRYGKSGVLRIDRDSVRPRDAWNVMRRRIHGGEAKILVGTQILAKGHDFPNLNLVGVLNADSLLYSADFRAPERLLALLTQVSGRAGRGGTQGKVLIQTEFPEHSLYDALKRQDYRAFAELLLAERREAAFPPFTHQALLRAEAPRLQTALEFLRGAIVAARDIANLVTLYDPVPAAMPRRAGRERAQLLVQCESRSRLQQFLGEWCRKLEGRSSSARWIIDVDPLEL
jgi:primosomal protein N' (replication factor Y)